MALLCDFNNPQTECLINDKRIKYDACGSNKKNSNIYYKKMAKRTKRRLIYIGKSNIIYINGVRNEFKNIMYFYKFEQIDRYIHRYNIF